MAVNGTEIATGQRWKTRDGREVEIVGYNEETNTEYVWDLSPEGSVTDEGYCVSFQAPSDNDIITLSQDEHGFIPWNGGECPVSSNTLVEYKMRDYGDDVDVVVAKKLCWNNSDSSADIIAYRVVQQAEQTDQIKEIIVETKTETKEEPKYTVEQVYKAINDATQDFVAYINVNKVKSYLAKTQDPEYNKYLELKAKFEKE